MVPHGNSFGELRIVVIETRKVHSVKVFADFFGLDSEDPQRTVAKPHVGILAPRAQRAVSDD